MLSCRCCLHSVVTTDSLATVWTAVDDVFTSVNTKGDETAPHPTPYDEDHKTRDPGERADLVARGGRNGRLAVGALHGDRDLPEHVGTDESGLVHYDGATGRITGWGRGWLTVPLTLGPLCAVDRGWRRRRLIVTHRSQGIVNVQSYSGEEQTHY